MKTAVFILTAALSLLFATPLRADTPAMTLDVCPDNYGGFHEDAPVLSCTCPAEAEKAGTVFGANPYYWQSGVCRAALHAGAIGGNGGQIVLTPEQAPVFPAATRNGVSSRSWGPDLGFRITGPSSGAADHGMRAGGSSALTLDVCPDNYGGFHEDASPLSCTCPAGAEKTGAAFGANPYYWQSDICRAALHAGLTGPNGGQIVVTPERAPVFPATTRNGVSSRSWGADFGFRINGQNSSTAPQGLSSGDDKTLRLDVCPDDYSGFHEDTPALSCTCPAAAGKNGTVYGANPYYWQSAVCRAALHAGVIGPRGGQIFLTPEKAPVFPATTRNGVSSRSWGADLGFHVATAGGDPLASKSPSLDASSRIAPRPPALPPGLDASGRPIQAPIAETLRTRGKVQVYINFDTDRADIQSSSAPVLNELLAALNESPDLKVDLVGHTDAIGGDAHNQDLSKRRAATVYLWLVQHGIARERLHSDGRGFLEPIASNDTAAGRALNRRVEVKAINQQP